MGTPLDCCSSRLVSESSSPSCVVLCMVPSPHTASLMATEAFSGNKSSTQQNPDLDLRGCHADRPVTIVTASPTTPSGLPSTSASPPTLIRATSNSQILALLQKGTVSTSSSIPMVPQGDPKSAAFPSVVSQLGLGGGSALPCEP